MSTSTEISEAEAPVEAKKAAPKEQPFAVLIQLEDIAVNGRKAAYDTLVELLAGEKIKLSVPLFSRYCLRASSENYLPEVMEAAGSKKTVDDKFVAAFDKAVLEKLLSNAELLNTDLAKVVSAAAKRDIRFAALTGLPEGSAEKLLDLCGLAKHGVQIIPFTNGDKSHPGPNTWLRSIRSMEPQPKLCGVVGCSMSVCKAALSADMRCIAVPDEFTEFQDFSGAQLLLEAISDVTVAELIDTLFPES